MVDKETDEMAWYYSLIMPKGALLRDVIKSLEVLHDKTRCELRFLSVTNDGDKTSLNFEPVEMVD